MSTSVTEGPVGALLAESFVALEREQPSLHARMCQQLQHRTVEVRVGPERFYLGFTPTRSRVDTTERPADVRIVTSRGALGDVLGARLSLAEAVLTDALEVVGPLASLLGLHEGLVTYVHGAVRCPSFPSLLTRLRAVCREAPSSPTLPEGESHGPGER